MEPTGVVSIADRLVDTLSGGERQGVRMAMPVAQGPPCLLLDEPASALDIAHQVEMLILIRQLSRDRRIGVIAVLRDVTMAARFCDDIVALYSGQLIARRSPENIMTPESVRSIYGIGMGVIAHPDIRQLFCFPR